MRKQKRNPTQVRKEMQVSDDALQRCIAEYSTGRFKLVRGDVSIGGHCSASAKHRKVRNRKLDVRACTMVLTHRPTGVSMNGYIKAGHYSKREMQKLKAELIERYLPSLEYLVKRYLKACMARQFGPLPKGYYDG